MTRPGRPVFDTTLAPLERRVGSVRSDATIDAINGEVVRRARLLGVSVPATDVVYHPLEVIEAGRAYSQR